MPSGDADLRSGLRFIFYNVNDEDEDDGAGDGVGDGFAWLRSDVLKSRLPKRNLLTPEWLEKNGHSIQKRLRYDLGSSCVPLHGASASSSDFGIFLIFPGRFFRPSPISPFQNHHKGALSAHGSFAC